MKAVTFLLHTQQPILATSLQGDPNSDVSYPYIPGSMIRGVLIGRYLKRHGLRETDDILDIQRFPDVTRLFFDDEKTRYLNAYPADNNRKRTLPVPRSWYKDKGVEFSETTDEDVYDFSKIPIDEREENLSPKLLKEDFCTVEDDAIILYRVKRRINIHNQRDRKKGRGTEGNGAVFSYDAIDARQTFQAAVLCDSQDDKSIIESLLQPEDIWLGGSQSAGYGHTIIELVQNNSDWHEVGIPLEERIRIERNENLTITLLSDTIIRNDCGQVVADPEVLRHLLSKLLAVDIQFKKIKYKNESGEEKEIEDGIYAISTIVGGFNRKWGLPLPQTSAFAAGSVFIFNKVNLDLQRIKILEDRGIGERRVDGFGRFVLNWLDNEQTEYKAKLPQPGARSVNTSESLAPESLKIATNIATRIVRKKLDELLLKQVSSIELLKKDKISNSQLSRLMIVARKALSELEIENDKSEAERKTIAELAEPVRDLMHNLPSNARKQFESTRLSTGERLDEQIHNWLNSPDSWLNSSWRSDSQTKSLVASDKPTVSIANVPQGFDNYTALEYSLRLIIAVAKKTMKEKNSA
jgi:CRISPR-associated protein Csx10